MRCWSASYGKLNFWQDSGHGGKCQFGINRYAPGSKKRFKKIAEYYMKIIG